MKRTMLLALILLLLTACQPTPKTDAVREKNTNQLIEAALATDLPQSADASPAPVPQVPERFAIDCVAETTGIRITGDVPIRVLSDGAFPMLRVEASPWKSETLQTLVKRLLHSETAYVWDARMTRAELERLIAIYIGEPTAEDKAAWFRDDPAATEEEWLEYLEERKGYLAEYQAQYRALPENDAGFAAWDGMQPEALSDGRMGSVLLVAEPAPTLSQREYDRVELTSGENGAVSFTAKAADPKRPNFGASIYDNESKSGVRRIDEAAYDTAPDWASITPSEAASIALAPFAGLCEYAVESIWESNDAMTDGETRGKTGREAYLVRLTPRYLGASLCYCRCWAETDPGEAYASSWPYEHAAAAVGGDGTLLGLEWSAPPHRVTGTVTENAKLLPFDEIRETVTRQLCLRYASYTEELQRGLVSDTLRIDGAALGLFRVREQDRMDAGLIMPVWFFTGRFEGGSYAAYDTFHPLLIVNAIDGSVVDPWKGY